MEERPIVGLAMFILNEKNEVLLGLRKGKVGNNTWGLPGGKLEKNEDFKDCIVREVKEETNLDIKDLTFVGITNDIMTDINQHYITIYFTTKEYDGEPIVMESDKCEKWEWFSSLELPENLFLPLQNFVSGNFIC